MHEPNSALDALTEEKVYHSFAALAKNKIGIIITHRLGVTKLADEIIVMRDRKVLMHGTHDMLMEKCAYYKELWEAGSSMYTDK